MLFCLKVILINLNIAGRLVAYVIGGIGAVMTAFGALFISLYCTRR